MNTPTIESLVEQYLGNLRSKSVADLLALPECEKNVVKINGKDVQIFTIHDTLNDGRHHFVLQATRQRWGGIMAKVVARGFEVSSDQRIRTLTPEELYDFT